MDNKCQLHYLFTDFEKLGHFELIRQKINKLFRRSVKRRRNYIFNSYYNFTRKLSKKPNIIGEKVKIKEFKPGDKVRVKSKKEIQATLDNWNRTGRCTFMEEQLKYCGTIQRVKKPVKRFLDETDWLMKRTKSIVILEGVICEGSIDFGKCDRSCFFMWRVEWLEKID